MTLSALARERTIVVGDGVRAAALSPTAHRGDPGLPVLRAAGADAAWPSAILEGYRGLLDQAQLLLSAT